jgi:hypothetical protein
MSIGTISLKLQSIPQITVESSSRTIKDQKRDPDASSAQGTSLGTRTIDIFTLIKRRVSRLELSVENRFRVESAEGMRVFLIILGGLSIRSTDSLVKKGIKLFDIFPLHHFVLSDEGLRYIVFADNVIKFSRVSNFDFDSYDIEPLLLADTVEIGLLIEHINEIHRYVFVDGILIALFQRLFPLKLLLQL